ncbi:hypothetical protein K505DRAFT_330673 [Melanomma pulvis-pyrius CBS 109.77]|uniref:Uncharacterized protein n=1 Tax=Melanomma pulvis-pyrius CBS 109.77 TaxID=1314802 RepID=A0A6A6WQ39_9PLEO|nr:hypothetical protein K505DRAFT_330673 [Melanomma pulvis-pyrius CBS 109.77]
MLNSILIFKAAAVYSILVTIAFSYRIRSTESRIAAMGAEVELLREWVKRIEGDIYELGEEPITEIDY